MKGELGGLNLNYRFRSGWALERRRMNETMLEVAHRVSNLIPDNINDNQLDRTRFQIQALEEYWYDESGTIAWLYPADAQVLPGSSMALRNDDTFMQGTLYWSVQAKTVLAGYFLSITPVLDGQALWAAEDFAMRGLRWRNTPDSITRTPGTAFPDDSEVCLGGVCSFVIGAGRSSSGLVVTGDGDWEISEVRFAIKSVRR